LKINLTPRFKDELQEIVDFIALDSIQRALKFYDELLQKINNLKENPYIYRKRESLNNENIRELIFKGYTIPYFIDKEKKQIIILGIFNRNLWD